MYRDIWRTEHPERCGLCRKEGPTKSGLCPECKAKTDEEHREWRKSFFAKHGRVRGFAKLAMGELKDIDLWFIDDGPIGKTLRLICTLISTVIGAFIGYGLGSLLWNLFNG